MAQNAWEIGALYPPGGLNNVKWSQPGGVGTQVFPAQQTSVDLLDITPFSELTGLMSAGCSHYFDEPLVQREFDYTENSSVALVCCPLCGYVQTAIEPFEAALSTVSYPMLIA